MINQNYPHGLVMSLPNGAVGVVVDSTKQGKNLYKATLVANNGDICILQFKLEGTADPVLVDYTMYDTVSIAKML